MDTHHSGEQIRVIIVISLINWNLRNIDTEVLEPGLLLLHILNRIVLSESEFDYHNCHKEGNYAVHRDNNNGYDIPWQIVVDLP